MELKIQAPTTTKEVQARVDELLRWGTIFSILWLMGIGSAIAVRSGIKARRLIRESGGIVTGMGRVRWCLIVGSFGLIIWIPVVIVGIVNNL